MNKDVLGKVSAELGLPADVVKKVYRAYWQFIRDTIEALPLREELTEEQFNELKTNINIPSLGKLNCTYDRYRKVKKRYEYINKVKNAKYNKD